MPLIKHDYDIEPISEDERFKVFIEHPQAHEVIESWLLTFDLAKKHGFAAIEAGARRWLDDVNARIEKRQANAAEKMN